ncbi:MAG: VWA domain-containing protein [Pirellulaceae bacterium]|nr:VWA domain-containing protein [Pirellulaceae bacterium]
MKVIRKLNNWWQRRTGEEETPFDSDSGAFVVSLLFHLCLLLGLGFAPLVIASSQVSLLITTPTELEEEDLVELPEEFHFNEQPLDEIGANSLDDVDIALSEAPLIAEVSDIPSPVEWTPTDLNADININHTIQVATGRMFNENLAVKGAAGEGTTGADGAIDRITHEIMLSLEERKTLVVWLFDQSGSLTRQRQEINQRFDRIYEELGVIEASENPAFKRHRDKPLLSSVIAFGDKVMRMTEEPTDNVNALKEAVAAIKRDDSGVERVFSGIWLAADWFKDYRIPQGTSEEPERNVMIIALTDEAGDDQDGLSKTIRQCRRYAIPVYVVGVPAPFGRRETMVKWVDPDPEFDQTPQWGIVSQGPESFLPERIKLHFSATREDEAPIDSGFGPFSLTRLCYETGGIYFAVHPNRRTEKSVSKGETVAFSAHMKRFFDPEVMRKYRPDYVSLTEYKKRVHGNKARQALIEAARNSWIAPMEAPRVRFVKRSEAEFVNALTESQKNAAKLTPRVANLYNLIKLGEADRDEEVVLRWQAGFDLAMGRVLAVKVRTEGYNAMLAKAKRGLKFEEAKNNTWILKPNAEITISSQLKKESEKALMYLTRVVDDHPGTPWATLAQRELAQPLGWEWAEEFTNLAPAPRNRGGGGGNPGPGRDDQKRVIAKKAPKRAAPKL